MFLQPLVEISNRTMCSSLSGTAVYEEAFGIRFRLCFIVFNLERIVIAEERPACDRNTTQHAVLFHIRIFQSTKAPDAPRRFRDQSRIPLTAFLMERSAFTAVQVQSIEVHHETG